MVRKIADKIKTRIQASGLNDYQSLSEKKKSIFLNVFFWLSGSVLMIFIAINHAFMLDYLHLLIDSSTILILAFLYFLFSVKKRLLLTSNLFVLILCCVSFFYAFSGGVENTGLIAIVLLPVPVIMLMGRKWGLLVLTVVLAIITSGLHFLKELPWIAKYPFSFSTHIYLSFLAITILGYISESVFEMLYSNLQKTADSLRESREKYKLLSINREKFLSIISHDLKDQVIGFSSITDFLRDQYPNLKENERMDIINQLWESSHKNVCLLQDLQKWSTFQDNAFPNNPVNIKLEKIYKEVVELFDFEIEKKHISVFLKIKSNSEVFADYDMLSAIMRNLLSNAIRYVGDNGEIRIKSEEQGDFMKIEVRDNGTGIDKITLERLKKSVSSSVSGIGNDYSPGIGLLLVNEFVECNNGKLSIESQKGKGTRISFTVPLVEYV